MRFVALATVCALAGCATPLTIEQARARLAAANEYQVCQTALLGDANWGPLAEQERRGRGLDCAPYASAIIAQDAARRQQALQAYQLMQAGHTQPAQYQPVPIPQPRQPMNCTSQRIGNQVQTNCY